MLPRQMLLGGLLLLLMASAVSAQQAPGRGVGGFNRGFGFGREAAASPETLLSMPEVRKELVASDEQNKQIDQTISELQGQIRSLFGNFRDLQSVPAEDRAKQLADADQKLQEARHSFVEKIAAILDQKQLARFNQLRLQREGTLALNRTEVADQLNLSAEQREKLQTIQEDVRKAGTGAGNFQEMSDDERRKFFSEMQERRRKAEADMLIVLTADQQNKLTELKGAEFKFPAPRGDLTITPTIAASGGDAPAGFDRAREDIARGAIETVEYDSKSVGAKRKMVIYTPPGYSSERKYPVLYLLHGAGDDETGWHRKGAANVILDNLYADQKIVPMIVVMPNGFARTPGEDRGRGRNGAFEADLLHDVLPYVESAYSVQPDAEHRALAGLSMGGGQALPIGLAHLDAFGWVGGFSSALFGSQAELIGEATDRKQLCLLWLSCGNADRLIEGSKAFHEETLGWLLAGCILMGAGVTMVRTSESAAAEEQRQVLRHVVLYKFKPEASEAQLQEVIEAFAGLPAKIDTIVGFEHGTNVSPEGKSEGFTHCFVVTFRDEAGRDAYLKHPAHQAYVNVVRDRREKVIVFDYWAKG